MSHWATRQMAKVGAAVAVLTASAAWAQSVPSLRPASSIAWRKLGLSSINADLAGLASGPVAAVWYAPDGGTLYAKLPSGQTFETTDFERWTRSQASHPETTQQIVIPVSVPEPARVVAASGDSHREWALGKNLFVSEDGGKTWTNMSAGSGDPVIGEGQRDVAVDASDSGTVAIANNYGVWQTRDNGKSWAGLNDNLPNLPVARILSMKRGAFRIALNDGRTLALADARSPWTISKSDSTLAAEAQERQLAGKALGVEISAVARVGDYTYAGSVDGRIWASRDRGATWGSPQVAGRGQIERFFIDSEAPRAALAVIAGPGAHVSRTVSGGSVWDDITGSLGDVAVHAAIADRASQTAFVATDNGIFSARVDMNAVVEPSPWTPVTGSLPRTRVMDLAIDPSSGQLYAALEGYGLFTAPLPSSPSALRVTNAADFSMRPAAPGSLISVSGGKVTAARSGDLEFPLLASGDFEAQLQVPFEAKAPGVDLSIQSPGAGVTTLPLSVQNVSPAIFIDRDGAPFVVDADTGLTLSTSDAAHPRMRLQLMATGLGRVQPDWPTGVPAPAEKVPRVVAGVQAYLDGVPVEVSQASLAPGYVGYYLVEIQLPAILNAGPAELYLVADGQESNRVTLMVEAQ
jgi:uncharacterized protein (TIGR03437 family)